MKRRDFIATTATALVVAPRIGWAQERRRIAIVDNAAPVSDIHIGAHVYYGPLLEELEALGWVEGQTLIIERYSADGEVDQFPIVAAAIGRSQPDLIYARGHTTMLPVLQSAAPRVPIVAVMAPPVETGLVESLARPGANLTGPTVDAGVDLQMKRMQLLLELIPNAQRVGWINRRSLNIYTVSAREAAGRTEITLVEELFDPPMGPEKYVQMFERFAVARIDALLVGNAIENNENRETIVELVRAARVPAIYAFPSYARAGGLMTYGPNLPALFRRAAHYVDSILKGANPAEMPIEQPTEFDLVVNLSTAKELGLSFPTKILLIANEVIE